MNPLTLCVLISGNGSNLQAIIDAIAEKKLHAKIIAVISDQSDAYGLERAHKANIPTEIILKKNYADRTSYDAALLQCLKKYNPDLVVLAGFMRIIGPEITKAFEGKLLNIHPALLPKFPGLHTHEKVLAAHETEHGCSIHFVSDVLDGGPIIAQAKFPVTAEDTVSTLKNKTHQLEHQLYPMVIEWCATKRLKIRDGIIYLDDHELSPQGADCSDLTHS